MEEIMEIIDKYGADKNKWYLSIWFIVIMFIVFWPAGIALLILRNAGRKNAMFIGSTDKRKYILAGAGLIVLGIFQIKSSTVWGILMIIGGGALLYYSKTLVDKAERNKKYIDLIVNQREGSIDNIAGVCSISYDKAVRELKYLQTVGVLKNISIDEPNRVITLIESTQIPERNSILGQEEVTCTCPGCGATKLVIKGSTSCCEYCDTPMSAS
ncbi:hypothetical protein [Pseudobutyrivibrio xylanivorans]|uniref:Uncharacterized protein n=1 Tax=Pseudobutyrivibrio xylanivorans DSM 14809 TaxID=1123012 RepID=A0A1M6K019_PSEXY|nr:hypothetical protein [Pseudobutyrivibrio xylanivorans]SHJ52258.1 hypothetical protein SAMN02745725_02734 [Pseudobutyrivibrio xylanivorans DSM 14809]